MYLPWDVIFEEMPLLDQPEMKSFQKIEIYIKYKSFGKLLIMIMIRNEIRIKSNKNYN